MQAKNIVKNNFLIGTEIWVDSPEWFHWLPTINAFRYEAKGTNFNCNRRSNGKWYASKKIYSANGCKLIALYIGSIQDCNLTKLEEIAKRFSMNWTDFWHWYHGSERKESRKSKGKVIQASSKCETSADNLQHELQQLQLALEEITADRDRQLIRIADLQNRMHDEIKKAIGCQEKQLERLEAYNQEIDRANGYLEKDNARLQEENCKLRAEVESLRSNVSVTGHEKNQEDTGSHPWSIGSIQPRFELIKKSHSRRQFDKQGNYPVLPDGSRWRRLGNKQELPESERGLSLYQYYPANTVLYLCIG